MVLFYCISAADIKTADKTDVISGDVKTAETNDDLDTEETGCKCFVYILSCTFYFTSSAVFTVNIYHNTAYTFKSKSTLEVCLNVLFYWILLI